MEGAEDGTATELIGMTARALAALLRKGEVSAREVVAAHLRRIDDLDGDINAVCTKTAELAMERAAAADDRQAGGGELPLLHGLPIVHKDLLDTADARTTYGSAAFLDHRPTADALIVHRAREAGAIMLGKSNTPQFGTGGHTANAVFGTTVNPWDLNRSAGGSSGGSAAALAAGMTPLATGTDMAGSLRIPASFCNVVGFRPSPGRVPWLPTDMAWFPYVAVGPMARTVDDVALLLSAVAGPSPEAAISIDSSPSDFSRDLGVGVKGWRIAWTPTIAGLPVAADVASVLARLLPAIESLGVEIEEIEPDLTGANEAFLVWRAWYYATSYGELYRNRREVLDTSTASNVEEGLNISGEQLGRAELLRTRLYQRVAGFFDDVDILVMPCTPVSAFGAEERYPSDIGGIAMPSYLDWMRHLYYVTAAGTPALSLPAGFTDSGLPVGVQIVGGPRQDLKVLQFARALEQALPSNAGSIAAAR